MLSRFSHVWLCGPVDCSPPGSSGHGILQAGTQEWVATSSSRSSSQPRDQTHVCCISFFGRQVLYRKCHPESPTSYNNKYKKNIPNLENRTVRIVQSLTLMSQGSREMHIFCLVHSPAVFGVMFYSFLCPYPLYIVQNCIFASVCVNRHPSQAQSFPSQLRWDVRRGTQVICGNKRKRGGRIFSFKVERIMGVP